MYKGFDKLFTTTFATRTTCTSCGVDTNSIQSLSWSPPCIWGDSVAGVRPHAAWCGTCSRTTEHAVRSVPLVHAPLLLIEPSHYATTQNPLGGGDPLTKEKEGAYLIQPVMRDRPAAREWHFVGTVIPLAEGQLGFIARLDDVMTFFKGKQRLPIDLATPVPMPVFVLYEQKT